MPSGICGPSPHRLCVVKSKLVQTIISRIQIVLWTAVGLSDVKVFVVSTEFDSRSWNWDIYCLHCAMQGKLLRHIDQMGAGSSQVQDMVQEQWHSNGMEACQTCTSED